MFVGNVPRLLWPFKWIHAALLRGASCSRVKTAALREQLARFYSTIVGRPTLTSNYIYIKAHARAP